MGISIEQWRCCIGSFHVSSNRNTISGDSHLAGSDKNKERINNTFFEKNTSAGQTDSSPDSSSSGPDSTWNDLYSSLLAYKNWFKSLFTKRTITAGQMIVFVYLLLLCCGDINPNPGPTNG